MTKRLVWGLVGLACFALGSAAFADLTIKEVMDRAHKGSGSLLDSIGKDLKTDQPDWPGIQKESKELVVLGTALGKAKPPRGEQTNWDKLCRQYIDNAKALDAAVDNKNKDTAQTLQKALKMSCRDCHMAHRPPA
jgi:hypothetical protein